MKLNGIRVLDQIDETPEPGTYFLILVRPQGRDDFYRVSDVMGQKNMSGEPTEKGWLGETNNVNRYADGQAQVYLDKSNRRRIRRLS